jgi:hypothetical protein
VVADVRLHTLRPAPEPGAAPVDEVRHVDLGTVPADDPDGSVPADRRD